MRRALLIALLLLFPVIAAAQITISPATVAYNADPAIAQPTINVAGTALQGNIATTVSFTNSDGGVAEVVPNSVSATLLVVEVPLAVTDIPGPWAVTVNSYDDTGVRVQGGATLTVTSQHPPTITVPEVVTAEATSASGANVSFDVAGISFVDPPPAPSISCDHPSGSLFPLGSTTVVCTATDSFGSVSASFRVFVVDTTGPVITVPAPFVSQTQVVTYTVTAVDAVDGSRTVTCSPASGSTFPNGVTTVQCSASDTRDNTSYASFIVSVNTPVAPTLTLPSNMTVIADDNVGIRVAFEATADQDATVVCNPESGSFFAIGTTTVNCTATNIFNVSSTGSFTITVIADPRPILFLPGDITVDPTGPSGTVVTWTATATDSVDGSIPVTCTPMSGSTFPLGATFVLCSATNSRNYTRSGSFYVFVRDGTPPVLNLPPTIHVSSSGSPDGTEVFYTATATDAVDGDVAISCEPISGALFPDGLTTVQCRAFDSAGNLATGSFDVVVGDTTPPVVTVPSAITVEATSAAGAVVTFTATAVDNVDGPLPVICTPPSGSTFPIGVTSVTCRSTDSSFNVGMASFNVTVQDTTPPALTLPANITAEATSAAGAVVTYTASATDIVDGNVAVTCTPLSGSTFPLGTTTVQCSATDVHSNTATGSFTVTVQDTTPPALTLPSNITAEATGPSGATVTFTASATDIVDGSVPVLCTPASGSTFALGTNTVNCTATDAHSNTATGSFTVTVQDTTPPTIVSITTSPRSILWPPDHELIPFTITVVATDLVDPNPTSHIVSVTSDQPIEGTGSGDTAPDWVITGPLTVQLRAERSSGVDRHYTITIATSDFSGNTATGTVVVVVEQMSNGHSGPPSSSSSPSPRGRAVGHP